MDYMYGEEEMATIELTPELVFERRSDVSSPPGSLLSYSSIERSSVSGNQTRHPYADLLFPRGSHTLPRPKMPYPPMIENMITDEAGKRDPSEDMKRRGGFTSPASATLPKQRGRSYTADSDYGIMISIKDIKGHPFVILEDKDKHKHMVTAPEGSNHSNDTSLPKVETDTSLDSTYVNPPTPGKKESPPSVKKGGPRGMSRARGDLYSGRSRSLPRNRANAHVVSNRSRSMSPPRKSKSLRRVDIESIKPVSSLIGYFEAGPSKEKSPVPEERKPITSSIRRAARNSSEHKPPVSNGIASPPPPSISTTTIPKVQKKSAPTMKLQPEESLNKEEATKPAGRYFALTSPGFNNGTKFKDDYTVPHVFTAEKTLSGRDEPPKSNKGGSLRIPEVFQANASSQKPVSNHHREPRIRSPSPLKSKYLNNVSEPKKEISVKKFDIADSGRKADTNPTDGLIEPVCVSRAVFVDLSHQQLADGSKPERKAQRLSTTPRGESESSTSELSTSESQKSTPSEQRITSKKLPDMMAETIDPPEEMPASDVSSESSKHSHKRTSSIKFEKISSEDVTKKEEESIVPVKRKHPLESSPSVPDFQLQIGDLQNKIKKLQSNEDDLKKLHEAYDDLLFEQEKGEKLLKRRDEELGTLRSQLQNALGVEKKHEVLNQKLQNQLRSLQDDIENKETEIQIRNEKIADLESLHHREMRHKSKHDHDTFRHLEDSKKKLEKELKEIRAENVSKTGKIEKQEGEIAALNERLQKEQAEKKEQETERMNMLQELKNELDIACADLHIKVNDLQEKDSKIRELRSDHHKETRKQQQLSDQLDLAHSEKQSLEQDLKNKNKEIATLKAHQHHQKETRDKGDAVSRLHEEIKSKLIKELEDARAENEAKSKTLRDAELKNKHLQKELHRMDQELEDELREGETVMAEYRKVKLSLAALETNANAAARDKEKWETEIKEMKEQLSDDLQSRKILEKTKEENEVQLKKLHIQIEKLSRQVEDANERMRGLQEKARKAEHKCEMMKLESENSARMNSDLEDSLAKAEEDLCKRNAQLRDANADMKKLQNQVDLLCSELENRRVSTENEKAQLDSDLSDLRGELDVLKAELAKVNDDKHDLEEKVEKHSEKAQKESDEIKELKKEIQKLRDSIDEKTQQIFAAEDTIYGQKGVIEELTVIQQTAEKSAYSEMEKFMNETEKQFAEVKTQLEKKTEELEHFTEEKRELETELLTLMDEMELLNLDLKKTKAQKEENENRLDEVDKLLHDMRNKLTIEQRHNSQLKDKLAELESSNSSAHDMEEKEQLLRTKEELMNEVKELDERLELEIEEKSSLGAQLQMAHDKMGNLHNELEIEKNRVDMLLQEKGAHKEPNDDSLVPILESKIRTLEEKLQQEAKELSSITSHHHKTEKKLQGVLKQAEDETNKALSDRQQLQIETKDLKQHLKERQEELNKAESTRRQLENELLQQREANYKLRKTIAEFTSYSSNV